jgi:hypothetical protein
MFRKFCLSILLIILLSISLYGERAYVGIESDFFFPRGDWAEGLDFGQCLKISVKKYFYKQIGGEISIGSLSFTSNFREEAKLSMFPIIYFDALAEHKIKRNWPLYIGIFVGANYTNQNITYGEGVSTGSVYGWSFGGYGMLKLKSIVKPIFRFRYLTRKDTDGTELAIGVSL